VAERNASNMPKQVSRSRGRQIYHANTSDLEVALEQRRVDPSSLERGRSHGGRVRGREETQQIPLLT